MILCALQSHCCKHSSITRRNLFWAAPFGREKQTKTIIIMRNVPIVEKESLKNMIFPREEVLKSVDMARDRRAMLERATVLSNLYHNKVKIVFEDRDGSKMVDTTIWATTDSAIMLKGGVVIPIHRIHSIDLL